VSAQGPTVLARIVAETRAELERRKRDAPQPEPGRRPAGAVGGRPFAEALSAPGVGVIAEFKRRSPSAGELRENPDLQEMVKAYEVGGAVALSVLTEGPNFSGSLEDLAGARAASSLPILRKDFIVDPYQLYESRSAGVAAVLLIVAALSGAELSALHDQARAMGLEVLVEVHDRGELERALEAGAEIIGINNRDLRDFSVEVGRTLALAGEVPAGVVVVSESGIAGAGQLAELERAGVHAVLVGEALMRAADPGAAVRALRTFRRSDAAL